MGTFRLPGRHSTQAVGATGGAPRRDPPVAPVDLDESDEAVAASHPGRMTMAEEYRLAKAAMRKGARALDARNALVMANYGLIHLVAQAYRRAGIRYEDLMQEGAMGLLRAAETFDPDRGVRFGTYAVYWIRSKVQRFIEHQRRETNPFMAGVDSVAGDDGRRHIPRTRTVSLETPVDMDGERSLSDLVSDPDDVSPERRAMDDQEEGRVAKEVWKICRELGDPRLEVIVRQRLLSRTPETLAEVGKRLRLSREGARLLEARVLGVARERLQDIREARS